VNLFVKRYIEGTPTQELPGAAAPLLVSTPEVTALDLISYASSIGGFDRAVETLMPIVPLMRADRLREAMKAENAPGMAQRLGFLFETAGNVKLANIIHKWIPRSRRLVPLTGSAGQSRESPISEKWRIINNLAPIIT
jgi:hypothetical protein